MSRLKRDSGPRAPAGGDRDEVDLAGDRLVGVQEIADFRGEAVVRTRHLVRIRAFPFYREGRIIIASKAALRADHLRQASRGASQ
jgi:hypothetical protein